MLFGEIEIDLMKEMKESDFLKKIEYHRSCPFFAGRSPLGIP